MLLLLPLFGPFFRPSLDFGREFHFEFQPNISRDFDAWQSLFLYKFIRLPRTGIFDKWVSWSQANISIRSVPYDYRYLLGGWHIKYMW